MQNIFGRILRSKLSKWGFIRQLTAMAFCLLDDKTPKRIKVGMAAALIYVIFPFDVVPDVIPVVGWLDDAGILAGMLWLLRRYIQEEHWCKADALLFRRQD